MVIGEMSCENDHEWIAVMTSTDPIDGLVRPVDQTEYCPVCGLLNYGDAEDEDLADFIPSHEMEAHRAKFELRQAPGDPGEAFWCAKAIPAEYSAWGPERN